MSEAIKSCKLAEWMQSSIKHITDLVENTLDKFYNNSEGVVSDLTVYVDVLGYECIWLVAFLQLRFVAVLCALLNKSPFSVRMEENTHQKKLHIWTLFTQ